MDVLFEQVGSFEDEYRLFCRSVVQVDSFDFSVRRPLQGIRVVAPAVRAGARLKPDVVYDNLFWSLPWSTATGALCRAPVVAQMHGFPVGHPSQLNRVLAKRFVKNFIAVSDFSRDLLTGIGVKPEQIDMVHNGIDPATYPVGDESARLRARQVLDVSPEAFLVLFCGRIEPLKGLDTLLDAVRLADPQGEYLELLIVGGPISAEYLERVRSRPNPVRCHWRPEFQSNVLLAYHAADVVAVPSVIEAFGRVVIEGMATGRPVVASRAGGLPEILSGPFDRFLFPTGDAPALAALLNDLKDWRTHEPLLGDRCARHVEENFSLARMVDGIEGRLDSAVSRHAMRPNNKH